MATQKDTGSYKRALSAHNAIIARWTGDLEKSTRTLEISAAEANAGRWWKRARWAAGALRGIAAEDFAWGCAFTGSRADLIRAGLIDAKHLPTERKDTDYELPLNHKDGYYEACYGSRNFPIPPHYEAHASKRDGITYAVHVRFEITDDVRGRMERAIRELERPDVNMSVLRSLILAIPPVPLSVALPELISASRTWPKWVTRRNAGRQGVSQKRGASKP